MKILQVVPSFVIGGAEAVCEGLSVELKKAGNEVCAVSLYDLKSFLTERLEKENIPIHYLGKKSGIDLGCIAPLKKIIADFAPDVIHTHLNAFKYVYAAAKGTDIPIIHTVHNVAYKDASFLEAVLYKRLFKSGRAVPVALSEEVKRTIVNMYKLPPEKVPVIINGIDLSRCIKKEGYEITAPVKLVHVGRFYEQKNHTCMLEAIRILKQKGIDARLDFCGDGPLFEQIKTEAKNLGVMNYITFSGVTDNVYSHLNGADIFILPSLWEGVPMTVIEAMATALPVVCSAVGGVPDMIKDGENGLLISPKSSALANAVEKLYIDEDLRRNLGLAALLSSERFSAETMAKNYLELYLSKKSAI